MLYTIGVEEERTTLKESQTEWSSKQERIIMPETVNIVRCRNCKHWTPRFCCGSKEVNDWTWGKCAVRCGDNFDIDVEGDCWKTTIETESPFFCAAGEEKEG
jgi:hypothetical protein